MPVLTVFAGPNGSGKSSFIRQIEFEGKLNLLEPDAIARHMNEEYPRHAGIAAGREVLRRTAECVLLKESFAIETTLSGKWTDSAIRAAQQKSFFIRLLYVCLDNPERCIQRVRERVKHGGHDVPDRDIRRRYGRSLYNARRLLRIVDQALVFDNSSAEPKRLLEMRHGQVLDRSDEMPDWATGLLGV